VPERVRGSFDATDVLTIFLFVSFIVPSPLVFGSIGASGTPGNIVGLGAFAWWLLCKVGTKQGIDRGLQPVRIALTVLFLSVAASWVVMYSRASSFDEVSGANRGIILLAALAGVSLVAADGLKSLERIHVLMRRMVFGTFLVALGGIFEFVTHYIPAQRISIPGLTRNVELLDQGRGNFARVQSTTLHPIEFGALMGLMLPVALHYATTARTKGRRQWAAIQALVIAVALPLALSRTGVIAVVIGLFVAALDWSNRRRGQMLVAAAVLTGVLRVAVPGLVGSITGLFVDVSEDTSTQLRTQRYTIAADFFSEHPWFGRGYNTLFPATHQVFDNAYLYLATEMGVFGIAAMLGVFLTMFFLARGARLRSTDLETRGLAQALAGSAIAMMVIFSTADMMSFNMLMGVFFVMFGVAGAMWRLTGGQRGGVPLEARALAKRARRPHLVA
jgi:hypothetical protein